MHVVPREAGASSSAALKKLEEDLRTAQQRADKGSVSAPKRGSRSPCLGGSDGVEAARFEMQPTTRHVTSCDVLVSRRMEGESSKSTSPKSRTPPFSCLQACLSRWTTNLRWRPFSRKTRTECLPHM